MATDTDPIPTTPVREWEAQVYEFLERDVPPAVRERGSRVVADVLAAAVAGMATDANRRVAMHGGFGDGAASVLGTDRRVEPGQAALLNTSAAITQEIEEGHNSGGHVGASIVAGSVGVAEANGVAGEDFVDACAKVYELCTRLERAIFAMKDRINDAIPWLVRDPHSTWTTVGPAVTSALSLGASADELRETFRTAANLAVVSMHDPYAEGAPARNFTAGFSAQAGVNAALAGTAGLRGSAAAVEAVYDPLDDMLDGRFAASLDALGETWEITENYFKPYPSCRYTHAPLDALRAADVEDVDPAAIERVDVYTYANGVDMDHVRPRTMTAAKFSTPYVLARCLTSGAVSLEHFTPDAVSDSTVADLSERVHLHLDEGFEAAFPDNWGARVEITTEGSVLVGERAYPRGDHRDPLEEDAFWRRSGDLLAWGLDGDDPDDALRALQTVTERPVTETIDELRSDISAQQNSNSPR